MKKWCIGLGTIISCAIIILLTASKLKEKAAISIIGGADGPTTIFISGTIPAVDIFLLLALIIIVAVFIYCKFKRKN